MQEECRDLEDVIQDDENVQGIDDDNMLNIKPMVQEVEVDLILMDLWVPKDFSIQQSPDIWIADTGTLNDGTEHKKGLMN